MLNNDEIRDYAVSFFSKLYSKEDAIYHPYHVVNAFPILEESRMQALGQAVEDDEEIKNVIFSMKALKALGIDGLHALFYQTQWHVVGKSVCSLIKGIFNGNEIPKELNKTLIVLVPKSDNPISRKLFRPISLCPVIYKTITKLLANRLKSILPDLIGPTQTSFIPGRHITENIVVAQEVFHSMRRKKGRIGQMAIKVDLEKAYDRLSWDFIYETLREFGLPTILVRLIMECITTATMQLLWNGEITESFTPSRGIRQGDPISPYIFVLCIERLSHGVNDTVKRGYWKPIKLSRAGTSLSHLFFANDLILLAEASCRQAMVIMKC